MSLAYIWPELSITPVKLCRLLISGEKVYTMSAIAA